jgi:hypothetical protein
MAFNIGGNPMTCDSTSVADFNAALVEMNWNKQFIEIATVSWQNAAASGDAFILNNSYGESVVNCEAAVPNNDFYIPVNGSVHGLVLDELDSGNIAIYLRGK